MSAIKEYKMSGLWRNDGIRQYFPEDEMSLL